MTPIIAASTGLIGAFIALIAALFFVRAVINEDPGNDKMQGLREKI